MTDDVGFASGTTFGGVIPTPTMDKLAEQGLRYTNFHTTGICSPSRAALLTGRNHHAVATGTVTDLARAEEGYVSVIPKSAATLPQVLRANGFSTAAFGKNHNVPTWQSGPLGPFDQWMSGLGFDYFYGFHAGHTNQFYPDLVENNSQIESPEGPDYILDRDLADRAVHWLRTQRTQHGDKPFFLYYAPGTAHTPLHAPPEWLARFRGKFDAGWDVLRDEIFQRQKRLGVIPLNARLAPMPPEVKPWKSLNDQEKKVYARLMEAYAAALAFCDDQLGRVIGELERSGQLENTLIVYIQGDNGATPEGQVHGSINSMGRYAAGQELAETSRRLEDVGGPRTYPVAPLGFMMAMNTPFPYHKVVASRLGGIRNGMVLSWPKGISARGNRTQFSHLNDIMPTVLEATGLAAPIEFEGTTQQPFDGASLTYSFANPAAQAKSRQQYFEIFGNAALYKDGWFVASPVRPLTTGPRAPAGAAHKWELYDLQRDSSQTEDLADRYPQKLAEMRALFDEVARHNKVYPISADSSVNMLPQSRPEITARTGKFALYPSSFRYSQGTFPSINNRSWSIEADIDVPTGGEEGTLIAQGGKFSGWGLIMLRGVPTFIYRMSDSDEGLTRLDAVQPLPAGRHAVRVDFVVDGEGLGRGGILTMAVNGREVSTARLERTVALKFSAEDGTVGFDTGTALLDDYELPFRSRGLRSVTVELAPVQTPKRAAVNFDGNAE